MLFWSEQSSAAIALRRVANRGGARTTPGTDLVRCELFCPRVVPAVLPG
jgi:hypothetical protein